MPPSRDFRSPSFTPGAADAPALLDLFQHEDEATCAQVERALLRMGRGALRPVLQRLPEAGPPLRGRLGRLLGRLAQGHPASEARAALLQLLSDEDDKTRRNAIIALGHLPGPPHPDVEQALLAAWRDTARVDHRRSLAASLGKIGTQASLDLLRDLRTEDPELRRIAGRSTLMLARTLSRGAASAVRLDRILSVLLPVQVHCRAGLEQILLEECPAAWQARVRSPGQIHVMLPGHAADLLRLRTMLSFGWALPAQPIAPGEDASQAVARALTSPEALSVLRTFTDGLPRFRLAFSQGGHRRALIWRCAQAVAERTDEIRNDPTDSSWEVRIDEGPGTVSLELCPRNFPDPRFAYRKRDVPAASHPTLAAALARVAGAKADDVVWDPFTGSGLELIERALLGPYRSLHGTDLDQQALAAARENVAAAGIEHVQFLQADARSYAPQGVTLVLTNPPMGRRVLRGDDLGRFLDAFVAHAGRVLSPGGRLVWISPLPQRTLEQASKVGLSLVYKQDVDMGGFWAQLQVLQRIKYSGAPSPPRRPAR